MYAFYLHHVLSIVDKVAVSLGVLESETIVAVGSLGGVTCYLHAATIKRHKGNMHFSVTAEWVYWFPSCQDQYLWIRVPVRSSSFSNSRTPQPHIDRGCLGQH